MTVYPCSKARHAVWWRSLQAAGLPIVASWISWAGNVEGAEPSSDAWREHWDRCVSEATAADICLFYSAEGETACGQLLEAGAALSAGKCVFVVSPYTWTFSNHPQVRNFNTLEAAVTAIVAALAGTKARAA